MLIEPLVGAARAAQVTDWHWDGEHDIARHPVCPVCHPSLQSEVTSSRESAQVTARP